MLLVLLILFFDVMIGLLINDVHVCVSMQCVLHLCQVQFLNVFNNNIIIISSLLL